MGNTISSVPLFLFLLFLSCASATYSVPSQSLDRPRTFIIHVSKSDKPSCFTSHRHWYSSILRSLSADSSAILYTYDHTVNGFSARLTASQAAELRRVPGILSVISDRVRHIHTTRTPQFLGLTDNSGLWPNSNYAEDVIIGVLDTGIWPERPSFSDKGLSPVPSGWKGKCETANDFPASSCNRKIIGAKAYSKGFQAAIGGAMDDSEDPKSPRDIEGHGTHTASTAAGSVVANASFFQYARGEARGMAVKARIAVYKICWSQGCFDSDILAAMEEAVSDGVHVISLSVGSNGYASEYDEDSIAIGAFGATRHGVLVSASAGNSGAGPSTAVNVAPWILTVGASTIDREFPADVVLGDGRNFTGVSLYTGDPLGDSKLPLVDAADCGDTYCNSEMDLNSSKVTGKIVVCERGGGSRVGKGVAVKNAGGVGIILANTGESGEELIADAFLIPAATVGQAEADKIKEYVKSDPSPTATIVSRGTVIGASPPAPKIAAFSGRGPNFVTPEILKPDVIAPGLNILAGWTGDVGPSGLETDPRRVEFNIISGTSMSCPHVSGLAALLRKAHPDWTPAAIKSALMTTTYDLDNSGHNLMDLATGRESTPFIHGSGHVDPNKALDPGLVYDMEEKDYVAFLCAIGYNATRIAVFLNTTVECGAQGLASPGDLNYPSFSVVFDSNKTVVKYKRAVKNVASSTDVVYKVKVNAPPAVEISVSPTKLEFSEDDKTLSYEITFTSRVALDKFQVASQGFGSIVWSDGTHGVRSPVAVVWKQGGSAVSM